MSMYNHDIDPADLALTRRQWLNRTGMGLGSMALGMMFDEQGLLAADSSSNQTGLPGLPTGGNPLLSSGVNPLSPKSPHFAPKAQPCGHL